jgi:hypothetical protein
MLATSEGFSLKQNCFFFFPFHSMFLFFLLVLDCLVPHRYRRNFTLTAERIQEFKNAPTDVVLALGAVGCADVTYVNGVQVCTPAHFYCKSGVCSCVDPCVPLRTHRHMLAHAPSATQQFAH